MAAKPTEELRGPIGCTSIKVSAIVQRVNNKKSAKAEIKYFFFILNGKKQVTGGMPAH